jgi:hypothetical protein
MDTPDGPPAPPARQPEALQRLRRFVEPALLVTGAAAAMFAIHLTDNREPAVPRPAAPPATTPAAAAPAPDNQLRLVAPAIAAPGERIVVLAFRDAGLCGAAELRFDGTVLNHRLTGIAGSQPPDRVGLFLTAQVPHSARAGVHPLDLYGPVTNGSSGPMCAQVGYSNAKVTTTIIVAPQR